MRGGLTRGSLTRGGLKPGHPLFTLGRRVI